MPSLIYTLTASLASGVVTAAQSYGHGNRTWNCGEVNIYSTGLPAYHPEVAEQGANQTAVQEAMTEDFQKTINAGYNLKVVLMGSEQPIDQLAKRIPGTEWQAAHVGFGVRGSDFANLTYRLQDIIELYRDAIPNAPILFDYSPTSATEVFARSFPISEDCTNKPGKLTVETICDICQH